MNFFTSNNSEFNQVVWKDFIDLWQKSRKYWAVLLLLALQQLAMGKDLRTVYALLSATVLQMAIGVVERWTKESTY